MKWFVVAIVSLLAVAAWIGPAKINAWSGLMRQDLVAAVDGRLGEVRVRQAEIHRRIEGLARAVDSLREAQITAEVRAELVEKRAERAAGLDARARTGLTRLRGLIAAGEGATLAGTALSPRELEQLGTRLAASLEAVGIQRAALAQAGDTLRQGARMLSTRWEQGRAALASLKDQLGVLDAKVEALMAMREAAAIAGSGGESLALQFTSAQNELDELYGRTEAALRMEEDRWRDNPLTGAPDIGPLLEELGGSEAALQRIDALLATPEAGKQPGPQKGGGR